MRRGKYFYTHKSIFYRLFYVLNIGKHDHMCHNTSVLESLNYNTYYVKVGCKNQIVCIFFNFMNKYECKIVPLYYDTSIFIRFARTLITYKTICR